MLRSPAIGTALGIAVAGLAYVHGGFSVAMPVLAGLAGLAALVGATWPP